MNFFYLFIYCGFAVKIHINVIKLWGHQLIYEVMSFDINPFILSNKECYNAICINFV